MSERKYVVSVCEGPDCTGNGSDALVPAVERAVREGNLQRRCSVKRGGCYGLCEEGPNVIVRADSGAPRDPFSSEDYELTGAPGEVHYPGMDPEKAARVVREHIGADAPVAELAAQRR
jgi:(2Fe-2S) ferredoxin